MSVALGRPPGLPGYCAPTFTLMPVGSTSQRAVQVSGFDDIGRLAPLQRLVSASCSSGQRFAFGFLQIRSRPRHPCRSANSSPCRVSKGLAPSSECALPGAPNERPRMGAGPWPDLTGSAEMGAYRIRGVTHGRACILAATACTSTSASGRGTTGHGIQTIAGNSVLAAGALATHADSIPIYASRKRCQPQTRCSSEIILREVFSARRFPAGAQGRRRRPPARP